MSYLLGYYTAVHTAGTAAAISFPFAMGCQLSVIANGAVCLLKADNIL